MTHVLQFRDIEFKADPSVPPGTIYVIGHPTDDDVLHGRVLRVGDTCVAPHRSVVIADVNVNTCSCPRICSHDDAADA